MAQLVIVTGASRGLGRSIAIAFAKSNQTSCFVLVGRNAIDLEITKSRLVENQVPDTHIHLLPVDLSNMDHLGEYSDSMFDSKIFGKSGFESIIFVNNAATIGKLENCGMANDVAPFRDYLDFNVASACFLSGNLVQRAKSGLFSDLCKKISIVNVSSLAAIKPFVSWGMYCAGKAARDMYHAVLAEECNVVPFCCPTISIMSYAPGPLDTDMQKEIRESATVDHDTRSFFISMKDEGKLVNPLASAEKLVKLIACGNYVTGSHIDYFDKITGVDDL